MLQVLRSRFPWANDRRLSVRSGSESARSASTRDHPRRKPGRIDRWSDRNQRATAGFRHAHDLAKLPLSLDHTGRSGDELLLKMRQPPARACKLGEIFGAVPIPEGLLDLDEFERPFNRLVGGPGRGVRRGEIAVERIHGSDSAMISDFVRAMPVSASTGATTIDPAFAKSGIGRFSPRPMSGSLRPKQSGTTTFL